MDLNQSQGEANELFEAQAHIYRHLFNYATSMSLGCALELGIPDIVHNHGKPITIQELVSNLNLPIDKTHHLQRLMRLLIHSNFFSITKIHGQEDEDEKEGYVLTASSKLLLKNNQPNGPNLLPFANLVLDPVFVTPWQSLGKWFHGTESTVFETDHGIPMWEFAKQNPGFNGLFNDAMASDSRMMSLLVKDCDKIFGGVESLVDVGGGTGLNSKILLEAFPHMTCTVFDLPHVVSDKIETKNLKYVGGDMFNSIPSADAIFFKNVLHNWSDDNGLKILRRCRDAIRFAGDDGKKGKLIIIDMVVDEKHDRHEITETKMVFDMLMMVLVTGRERTEVEWERLFLEAGFSRYKITPCFGLSAYIQIKKSNASASAPVVCCLELWHACAGPFTSLPTKGNAVVYIPQGHLELLQSAGGSLLSGDFTLPPHVFCRVVDVKLHAEAGAGAGADDVFAQVSLIQDSQLEQKWLEVEEGGGGVEYVYAEDDNEVIEKSTTSHMFCKTLTSSDTSTHGGFSVPRRAAEDCFPHLDYRQQRPSQELVAKDLHGFEWKFRHIYRGQPRRHLLTTGWSAFVNKKKLVCGDAVLFLRGDDGVLSLGIRRATQVKPAFSLPPCFGQQLHDFDFSTVVNSISRRTVFSVYYNPRGGLSKFLVPYNRFLKSLANPLSTGMRFTMRVETEDAEDRRCTGIITGFNDIDPARWPGSKWRCLMVRWDYEETARQIEFRHGRSIDAVLTMMLTFYVFLTDQSNEASDLEKSMRFHKVLQGQEIYSFYRSEISQLRNDIRNHTSVGFGESLRFDRVLQGQEITSNLQYGERVSNSRNLRIHQSSSSSPSSVLGFQQAINQAPNTCAVRYGDNIKQFSGQNHQDFFNPLRGQQEEAVSTSTNSCRLFGFSLTEGSNGTKTSRCPNGEHPIGAVVKMI
ncbi:hypothetical protein SSX86_027005 [Deinandra increscens subsp. villosa]|uniref:Auxin response factor n=1 Tax=Deinandra increscens subsp. villosa TaxID=3103831 RepID=A0AAP0GMP5_9ASTR